LVASDDIERAFTKAVALHQRGELAQAETLYRQILASVPHHLDCLNLLGLVAVQTVEARVLERYRTCFPDDPAMTNLGNWHLFERENPSTFGTMYQFWIQKRQ
jgi:hypothetical protein